MALTITADTRFVADYLEQIGKRIDDMTPLMDAIGMLMETQISNRFETMADPGGAKWASWAESTKANYPADAHGRLLDRYGDMLRSLTHTADAHSATIGFGQPHAAYHEFGTKHMERRGLLFDDPDTGELGSEDREAILDLVSAYLKS